MEPGWNNSTSKAQWDSAVANMIDHAVPILKDQIDVRIVHKLKKLTDKEGGSDFVHTNHTLDVEVLGMPGTYDPTGLPIK